MGALIKILVTGANGQLGQEIAEEISYWDDRRYDYQLLSKEELSITDEPAVDYYFANFRPQYLINCAAYTAVDKAEQEKEQAFSVNADGVGILAKACRKYNTRLIHFSTDYVFDGRSTVPYKEEDVVNPRSVYGASKLEGERLAMKEHADTLIIRTSWVYSTFGKNFVKTMLRLMKEKEEINVVNDQIGSPTYTANIASLVQLLVTEEWHPGIYHFSNDGIISWYDFAVAIKEYTGSSCKINPIPTSGYPTPASRPAYSVLDKTKICNTFQISLIDWRESLVNCLDALHASE